MDSNELVNRKREERLALLKKMMADEGDDIDTYNPYLIENKISYHNDALPLCDKGLFMKEKEVSDNAFAFVKLALGLK